MCGRARCSLSREEVRAEASVSRWRDESAYFPSYNTSPSHSTPVIKQPDATGQRELHTMKWGLVPSYTKAGEKPDYFRMFNARSETVGEKGVFKKLLSRQRCIVLLNGFYEWKKEGKQKQPYFIFQEGHTAMRMAGLFDMWKGAGEEPMFSFTILTTDSSERLQWLHDRMPVILPDKAAEDLWLSGEGEETIKQLGKLCLPYNGEDLQWFPVDPIMSNMKKDGPECCQPLKRRSIATFFKPKQGGKGASEKLPSAKMAAEDEARDVKVEAQAEIDIRNADESSAELRDDEKGEAVIVKEECETEVKSEENLAEMQQPTATQPPREDEKKEDQSNREPTSSGGRQLKDEHMNGVSNPDAKHSKPESPKAEEIPAKRSLPASTPASRKKPKTGSATPKMAKITSFFGPPKK